MWERIGGKKGCEDELEWNDNQEEKWLKIAHISDSITIGYIQV